MSLLVRLPLNGNLNNYGSADVTVTVTGTTSYADGRAGKALSCNGSSYWTVTGVTLGSEASIACWSKTSVNGKMSWVLVSSVSDKLNLYESSQYSLNTGDGNNNLFKDGSGNAINCLHDNQWHHFVVTFGNSVAKLYIDGVYRGTATTFKSPATTSAKTIKLAGGYSNGHSYDWNGLISDFRVYNHCLSESEIRHLIRGKGLQIWLPLNGNLTQQGLSNVTVTNNSSVSVDDSGKIGKCYYFNRTNYLTTPIPFSTTTSMSLAFWIKIPETYSSNQQIIHIGKGSGWVNNRFIALIRSSTYQIVFHISDGTNTISYNCISTALTQNEWTHVSCTYENHTMKIYINGILNKTYTISYDPSFTDITNIGYGAAPNGQEKGKMYLNDIRIYDYCLSEKEVKELSKGLVLHYPLNRGGLGQENIIPNSKIDGSWTYPSSSYSDKYSTVTTVIPSATQYTLSFDAKSTVGGDKMRTHYYSPNTTTTCVSSQGVTKTASDGNMDFTLSTQWQRYWVTYTQTETTAVKHLICPRLVSGQGSGTVSVKNVKLEEGSIATPWCPHIEDTLATTIGLNGTTEYDCSGLANNGTRSGTFSWTSDTPKYNVSTDFAAVGNIVNNTSPIHLSNEFTIAWWGKINSWAKKWEGMFLLQNNATLNAGLNTYDIMSALHANTANTMSLTVCQNSSSYAFDKYKWTYAIGTWAHYACTYKAGVISMYQNGELVYTETITDNSSNDYYYRIGYRAGACDCQMSDFRIYATALSADDIAELYNGGVL